MGLRKRHCEHPQSTLYEGNKPNLQGCRRCDTCGGYFYTAPTIVDDAMARARRVIHLTAGEEQVLSTEKAIYEHIHEGRYSDLATFLGANGFRIHALIDAYNNIDCYRYALMFDYGMYHWPARPTIDSYVQFKELSHIVMVYTYEGIKYETTQNITIGNNAQIVCRPLTR